MRAHNHKLVVLSTVKKKKKSTSNEGVMTGCSKGGGSIVTGCGKGGWHSNYNEQ